MIPFKLRSRNGMVCLWVMFAIIGVGFVLFASRPSSPLRKIQKVFSFCALTTDYHKLQAENSALREQVRSLESLYLSIKQRVKGPEEKHADLQECDVQKHVHKKFIPQGKSSLSL